MQYNAYHHITFWHILYHFVMLAHIKQVRFLFALKCQQSEKQENRRLGIAWQKQWREEAKGEKQETNEDVKPWRCMPGNHIVDTLALALHKQHKATRPILPTTLGEEVLLNFALFLLSTCECLWPAGGFLLINNEQHHSQHLTIVCHKHSASGMRRNVSHLRTVPGLGKQLTSWRANNKVLPITELVLVLLNGCAWLVLHCVTVNVPSNVGGGFGTWCCIISLLCANVAITFTNSPTLCLLLQTSAIAKHADVFGSSACQISSA